MWTCNSAPATEAGRAGAIYHGDDPYNGSDGSPAHAAPDGDRWIPNYHYMGMKAQFWNVGNPVNGWVTAFRLDDWLVRNVAGLKLARLRSVSGEGADGIVIFRPFVSTYHTTPGQDIYDLSPGGTDDYGGVYAFGDGHATFETYPDADGYVAAHHDPIPQTWYVGGTPWETVYATQYARRY